MQIFIKPVRKDGKFPIIIGFDNGKRFNKIMTKDKLQEFLNDNQSATVNGVPFRMVSND